MCNCGNRDFEVREGKLFGEYDGDFYGYDIENYSYCPICGEHIQTERSERGDCDFEKLADIFYNTQITKEDVVNWEEEAGALKVLEKFANWLNQGCGALNTEGCGNRDFNYSYFPIWEEQIHWVKWKDLQPPKGVKGILIRFDNGRVWTDAHYYGYDEYRKKTVGDAMPVSWTFMDRKDPSEKSIHTVST